MFAERELKIPEIFIFSITFNLFQNNCTMALPIKRERNEDFLDSLWNDLYSTIRYHTKAINKNMYYSCNSVHQLQLRISFVYLVFVENI